MKRLLFLAPVLALAACEPDADPAPGGVSRDEAQALNEAAAMLDNQSVSLNALTTDEEAPR